MLNDNPIKCETTKCGFTLAEVLITLTIIGVVAALTIPTLTNTIQNHEYKVSYRKAYSDISQAFAQALSENSLTPRAAYSDANAVASEWAVMKDAFRVSKYCPPDHIDECWASGESPHDQPGVTEASFIDASGRAWAEYFEEESTYLVDTNGNKNPNKFGKDRWVFIPATEAEPYGVETGLPDRIGVMPTDELTTSAWCHYPPCYYKSWLY